MVGEVSLLSLPDDLLADVAYKTRNWQDKEEYRSWAFAASTCKRLWKLQLPFSIWIDKWENEAPQILHRPTLRSLHILVLYRK